MTTTKRRSRYVVRQGRKPVIDLDLGRAGQHGYRWITLGRPDIVARWRSALARDTHHQQKGDTT